MLQLLWPVLLVVTANTFYQICAKSVPEGVNAFASQFITYFVAMLCAAGMFFLTGEKKNFLTELSHTNWSAYVLGLAIVGLEFGNICVYRAGWKVSVANLVSSIILACVLLLVGWLLYKESISLRQIVGMLVCGAGLVLIMKQ